MAIRDIIPWSRGGTPATRYEPFSVVNELQREVNQLFERLPRGWAGLMERGFGGYMPEVDVQETDKAVRVEAELPGLTEKDVEVSLTPSGDELLLKGEKKGEEEHKERGFYRRERTYGAFERVIALPCSVEREKIEATFKDGVLIINMPKTEEATKPVTKIEVKKAD